jgi:hypothetical protein
MVARACGCVCKFQHYEVDKYRVDRLAKFQQTRCPACVAKLEDERRREVAARPPRGEAERALPAGASITLTRRPDELWAGVDGERGGGRGGRRFAPAAGRDAGPTLDRCIREPLGNGRQRQTEADMRVFEGDR